MSDNAYSLELADDRIAELKAEILRLRALLEAETWRPIETAPKDGTWVLLYWPMTRTNVVVAGHFYAASDGEAVWWSLPKVDTHNDPTHWRPLPSPPTEEGRG